jgi:hypothetical protein
MKTAATAVRTIASSPLLSYIYFNPIFRASRLVRRKLRRQLGVKVQWARLKTS